MVNTNNYNSKHSVDTKLKRFIWVIFGKLFFRLLVSRLLDDVRRRYLNLFGASIGKGSIVYESANIWLPQNLIMGTNSTIGPNVNVYNQGNITIGDGVVISQFSELCASSHDYKLDGFPLILCPIYINNNSWIASSAFIGPDVFIAENNVIGARSVVMKSTEKNSVYHGNPAKIISSLEI